MNDVQIIKVKESIKETKQNNYNKNNVGNVLLPFYGLEEIKYINLFVIL